MPINKVHWWSRFFTPKIKAGPNFPQHVAIIMDGNGRWANQRGLPRAVGHRAGMERIRDAITTCLDCGVRYLTLYAFSTENWHRPKEEVGLLMGLFQEALQGEIESLNRQGVRLRIIGLKNELSPEIIASMEQGEAATAANQALTLNIALNYGGRAELAAAAKGIVRAVNEGELDFGQINEAELTKRLFTAGQPDPDLLIRPGGERRISNFMIWQIAYAELYFTDILWPDFGRSEMIKAFEYYQTRERRFGRVKEGK